MQRLEVGGVEAESNRRAILRSEWFYVN